MIVAVIVVLVIFGGIKLYQKMSALSDDFKHWKQRLVEGFDYVSMSLFNVGIPLAVVAGTIQLGYEWYVNRADAQRVARLDSVAGMFKEAGEYASAVEFDRPRLALDATPARNYQLLRNQWLVSFAESHSARTWRRLPAAFSTCPTTMRTRSQKTRKSMPQRSILPPPIPVP